MNASWSQCYWESVGSYPSSSVAAQQMPTRASGFASEGRCCLAGPLGPARHPKSAKGILSDSVGCFQVHVGNTTGSHSSEIRPTCFGWRCGFEYVFNSRGPVA